MHPETLCVQLPSAPRVLTMGGTLLTYEQAIGTGPDGQQLVTAQAEKFVQVFRHRAFARCLESPSDVRLILATPPNPAGGGLSPEDKPLEIHRSSGKLILREEMHGVSWALRIDTPAEEALLRAIGSAARIFFIPAVEQDRWGKNADGLLVRTITLARLEEIQLMPA